MKTLKLNRPLTQKRDTSWLWLTARLHHARRAEQRAWLSDVRTHDESCVYARCRAKWIPVIDRATLNVDRVRGQRVG